MIPSKVCAQRDVIMAAQFLSRKRQFNISRFKSQQAHKGGRSFGQARTLCKSPPKKCALYSSHLNHWAITATCLVIEVVIYSRSLQRNAQIRPWRELAWNMQITFVFEITPKMGNGFVSKYVAGNRRCKYEFLNIHKESVGVGSCLLCVSCSRMPKTLWFASCLHNLQMFANQQL